jgi:hypothetical protein
VLTLYEAAEEAEKNTGTAEYGDIPHSSANFIIAPKLTGIFAE